VLNRVKEK